MKFFVTGASGQLGSALVKRLIHDGHETVAYLRHSSKEERLKGLPVTIGRGSLFDPLGLKKWMKGCDGVFHVAGLISWAKQDRRKILQSNVEGTRQVIQIAKELKISRVLVTGSVLGVGLPNRKTPVDETFAYNGKRRGIVYSLSKHQAQEFALAQAAPGFDVLSVNPGFIVGPESHLLRALQGEKLPFYFPGGTSFVSLPDVVNGHLLAYERGKSGEKYLLAGDNLSYQRAFSQIADYFGKEPPAYTLPGLALQWLTLFTETWRRVLRKQPPKITHQLAKVVSAHHYYSSKKAEAELGWTWTPLRESLQQLVRAERTLRETPQELGKLRLVSADGS